MTREDGDGRGESARQTGKWNAVDYRADFPLLMEQDIVYLDNAATTQRPQAVMDAGLEFYRTMNGNPLRGMYDLSVKAGTCCEAAREAVRKLIGADSSGEIVFTRNTTEAINLAAYSYGLTHLKEGDEIVLTIMEHHSNILPWQMVCSQTGAKLRYLYCDADGRIDQKEIENKITSRTRLAAVTYVSNVLGVEVPVRQIADAAHAYGAKVLVDAAQAVLHRQVDVKELGADFLAFSGHKVMGPMGIGVLYGRREILEAMPPFLRGGEMIDSVTEQTAVFAPLPEKFEAGTVNAAGAYGLKAAVEYLDHVGYPFIEHRETALTRKMMEGMEQIAGVRILGAREASERHGIVAFTLDGIHPHDVASIMSESNIALRAGHHCAQPLLTHLGISSAVRASLCFYNSEQDVERFLEELRHMRRWMGYESETNLQ